MEGMMFDACEEMKENYNKLCNVKNNARKRAKDLVEQKLEEIQKSYLWNHTIRFSDEFGLTEVSIGKEGSKSTITLFLDGTRDSIDNRLVRLPNLYEELVDVLEFAAQVAQDFDICIGVVTA